MTPAQAHARAAGRQIRWVSGTFDPLVAEHARMLAAEARPGRMLGVRVMDAAGALLPVDARARLVAALASVDLVVIGGRGEQITEDPGIRGEFLRQVRQRAGERL